MHPCHKKQNQIWSDKNIKIAHLNRGHWQSPRRQPVAPVARGAHPAQNLFAKLLAERHCLDPDDRIGPQGCRLMHTQSLQDTLQPLIRESSQFLFDVNIKNDLIN